MHSIEKSQVTNQLLKMYKTVVTPDYIFSDHRNNLHKLIYQVNISKLYSILQTIKALFAFLHRNLEALTYQNAAYKVHITVEY